MESIKALLFVFIILLFFSLSCGANSGADGAAGAAGTDGEAGVPGPAGEDGSGAGSAPQSPSGLTAEAISPSRIDVRWVFNTGSELGFNVQRSEGDDEWETIAGTAANVTVYHDESVECEHEYSYRVLAYNDYGESAPSNEESATADYCELDAPGDMTALLDDEQEDGAQRAILLSWSEGAGELPGEPGSYEIYRKTFDGAWSATPLATQPSDQTTYTDEDAACGQTFQYRVRAANENSVKSAFSNTATSRADACPLVDPSNLVATTDQAGSIDLSWDINDPDATGYLLQRREHDARAEWVTIADLPEGSTSYSDEGAACETAEYDYRLRAYNGDKQSAWIETLTPGSSYCPVGAPSDLYTQTESATSIRLNWLDNADNETGYRVWRDNNLIPDELPADTTEFVDSSLTCDTEHTYYVVAFNANVESDRSDSARGFTAGCPLLNPTNFVATTGLAGRIDLSWDINDTSATGYYIQRREHETEDDWLTIVDLPEGSTNYSDDGAQCETAEYDYRLRAYNGDKQSDWVETLTPGSSYCTVGAPSDLYANTEGATSIRLDWLDNADNETGFQVWRGNEIIDNLPADSTQYTDDSLSCQTEYRYFVTAYNDNVSSNNSNSVLASTSWCPLDSPTTFEASTDHAGFIHLTWVIIDESATGYLIQRVEHDSGSGWLTIADLPEGTTSYSDATAQCESSEYDYRLKAYNYLAESAWVETLTPGSSWCVVNAPTGLLAQAADDTSMQLTWTDNSDNETGFRVYRDNLMIHTTAADVQTYTDEGRVCETSYEYYVEAFNTNVTSDASNKDRSTTSWCPVDAPSGLNASTTQVGSVHLNWQDNSNDEMGYYVQRSETGLNTWSTIASLPSDSTSHQDESATCETTEYDYRVQAYDRNTVSDWSNLATGSSYCSVASPTGLYAEALGSDEIELSWVNNADNATGIRVYRDETELTTLSPDATSYNDTTVDCQTLYRYKLTAYTANVESDPSGTAAAQSDWCPITAPYNVATVGDGNEVTVSWEHDQQYVESFDVQRRTEGEGTWQLLETVAAPDTNVTDTTVACYRDYEYRVLAYNSHLESEWSDEAVGAATGCTPMRPRPILSDSSPESYLAFSHESVEPYTIEITGEGIAHDVQLIVGDYVMMCDTEGTGTTCQADDNGDPVADTCATQCTATLPSELVSYADRYVVRLKNPDPVFGGQNESESYTYLSIVAPLPEITRIWPRGLIQLLDEDLNPIPQEIFVSVTGRNIMSNAQFRLGPNYGKIIGESIDFDVTTDTQHADVVFTTENLYPTSDPYEILVVNPSPGGGERGRSFGVNQRIDSWDSIHHAYLGSSAASNFGQSSAYYRMRLDESEIGYYFSVLGKYKSLSIRNEEGYLLVRFNKSNLQSAVPFPDGAYWLDLEDNTGNGDKPVITSASPQYLGGNGSYGTYDTYETGAHPQTIEIVDLDEDGDMDIITGNAHGDNITIYFGVGDGTFSDRIDYPMGDGVRKILVVDINYDGLPDLVSANTDGNDISFRNGLGDGLFGEEYRLDMGFHPYRIAIADLNDDGNVDIAASDLGSGVYLRFGLGKGFWSPRAYLEMAQETLDVLIADINMDTVPDIVTASRFSDSVNFRLGQGLGTFDDTVSYSMGNGPYSVIVDDFNGDGCPDLTSADYDGATVSIRLGDGQGNFGAVTTYDMGGHVHGPHILVAADLNSDSYLDVISANVGADNISFRLGNGDGTFNDQNVIDVGNDPHVVAVSDFNNDGAPDIITASNLPIGGNPECEFYVFLGTGTTSYDTWHQELTDSFSDDPDQPWLPKYAEVGFTDLDFHQAAQTVTKVGVRVMLEWSTQPAGSVDLGLVAPDGQMVDLGSHGDFTPWPDDVNPTSWRLNKTFREYDFNGELGIAGLVDLHGLQPTDYWTLSIDNQTGATAEVKNFTVITDGSF